MEAARPATAADLPVLAELYRAATTELLAERGGRLWAATADRDAGLAEGMLDDPSTAVWVGTFDDVVVGYALVAADPLPGGAERAVLTDVYVDPGARGVGVGEALLDAAVGWARARGCVAIESVALPGMRETKNFFEAAGLVARSIVVSRPL